MIVGTYGVSDGQVHLLPCPVAAATVSPFHHDVGLHECVEIVANDPALALCPSCWPTPAYTTYEQHGGAR